MSKIQDSSQLTGSSNISEIIPHIIKIPTANLEHSTMANSQEVYLGDYNNARIENGGRNRKYLYLWNYVRYS